MTQTNTLQHFRIDYCLSGQPCSTTLGEFGEPSLEQIKLHLLLRHGDHPQVIEDAPWERPAVRSSLDTRLMEVGIDAIRVTQV